MKNFLEGTLGISALLAILGLVFLSTIPAYAAGC